jgi:poly(3-hydroxybutyrate) depolymerase
VLRRAWLLVLVACGSSRTSATATDAGPDAPAPSGCITDTGPGDHTFQCEGLAVDVSVPGSCPGTCGLVLDVHGALETGPIEEAHMALRPIATSKGYVVVQPTAPVVTAVGGPFWSSGDDDRIVKVLGAVEAVFQTDRAKTHMTGFSQGGYMTWRFLCHHADRFASVAPGAAGQELCGTDVFFESCPFDATSAPSRQIDVLFLAGRQDTVVPYSCMTAQRDALVNGWAMSSPTVIAQDAQYTRTRWTNAQGTTFEALEHDYTTDPQGALASSKGHCYPGSQAHLGNAYDQLACLGPNAFTWGAEVMAFFVAHPKN